MITDKITIHGKVPSKANCYKIITFNGHGSLAKTATTKAYEDTFFMQCPIRGKMIAKPFKLTLDVFCENNLPDLDNCFKVILDCLQVCKAIKNDRYCFEISGRKLIDKVDPRIEFTIEELM